MPMVLNMPCYEEVVGGLALTVVGTGTGQVVDPVPAASLGSTAMHVEDSRSAGKIVAMNIARRNLWQLPRSPPSRREPM